MPFALRNFPVRVLIFGTFDHLHPGHRFVLREAARRGALMVVVARDRNVERMKGCLPQQSEEVRRRAILQESPGALVVLGDLEDFLAPVRKLRPDLILLGYDQHLPPGVREQDLLCPIERLPPFEPERFKSSKLKKL